MLTLKVLQKIHLVLSSLLQIDWLVNPSLCLLNDDSVLCISSMQKRMLFTGFTAAKKTIIQNWFTPHMCGKTYWIHSLLQIVTYECTTARINGAKPSTIDAWQCFLLDIRDCIKEWLVLWFLVLPSLPPFLTGLLRYWVYVCCFVLLYFGCYVMMLCMKKKNVITKKKKYCRKFTVLQCSIDLSQVKCRNELFLLLLLLFFYCSPMSTYNVI